MRNVIFDIGNVIIRWEPYNALSHLFSNRAEMNDTLQRIGFFEWNIEQDRGRSWIDGIRHIKNTIPDHTHIFQAYADGLEAAHSDLVVGTSEIIEQLHANDIKLYGITNAALESFNFTKKTAPKLSLLRHITVSAKVRMVKPDPGIFEYCLAQNDLNPSETLFVDDSKVNCEGAAAVGLFAHQFTTADRLASELKSLNLL